MCIAGSAHVASHDPSVAVSDRSWNIHHVNIRHGILGNQRQVISIRAPITVFHHQRILWCSQERSCVLASQYGSSFCRISRGGEQKEAGEDQSCFHMNLHSWFCTTGRSKDLARLGLRKRREVTPHKGAFVSSEEILSDFSLSWLG